MDMKRAYHLDLSEKEIEGAACAFLPGDPFRAEKIARAFDPESREIAHKREFRTFLGRLNGAPVLTTSTGIGGPSASIVVDELAQLGVKTFLRVGTTGAIQENIQAGDVIITTGAVRMDGASTHYAPVAYPAVAHHEMVQALLQAASAEGIPAHAGVTASTDTFYPGQERLDSCSGYVLRRFQGLTDELRKLNVLNYEMESSTVLTMCGVLRLRGGCVSGVVVNRARSEAVAPDAAERGEANAVRTAVRAMGMLMRL